MDLFTNNYLFLYFFTLLLFLKPDKLKINQKIFITYLFAYLVDMTNNIPTIFVICITLLCLFLLLEYFEDSDFKTIVISKTVYKIIDFFYLLFTEYALLRFLIVIFLNTSFFSSIQDYFFLNHLPNPFIVTIQILILYYISNTIFSLKWEIESLDIIKKRLEEGMKIYELPNEFNQSKFEIVAQLEDKSYYLRNKCGTILTIEYLTRYLLPRIKHMLYLKFNLSNDDFSIKRKICYAYRNRRLYISNFWSVFKRIFNSFKRGHSTIEAQLLRTIGIKTGYNGKKINIIKRKIFEVLYTKIIFISLEDYYKRYLYENNNRMKDFIMYNYVRYAKSKIFGKQFSGLEDLFQKSIKDLTNDELFIGTLSFSNYSLNFEKIRNNADIYDYNLDPDIIQSILDSININK